MCLLMSPGIVIVTVILPLAGRLVSARDEFYRSVGGLFSLNIVRSFFSRVGASDRLSA